MGDDTGKRHRSEWPLSGPVDSDKEEITDRHTAVGDVSIRQAFVRLDERINGIEKNMARLEKGLEEVADAAHKCKSLFTGLSAQVQVHEKEDEGRHSGLVSTIGEKDRAIARLELLVERAATASSSWWKWVLGQGIAVVVILIGGWIVMERRISTVEARLEATKDKIELLEHGLDRALDRLEAINDRLQSQPKTP